MSSLLKADLEAYIATAGPEPDIDRKKPDLVGQYKRWRDWWWAWYQQPLRRNEGL